jgi:hypothetical protein
MTSIFTNTLEDKEAMINMKLLKHDTLQENKQKKIDLHNLKDELLFKQKSNNKDNINSQKKIKQQNKRMYIKHPRIKKIRDRQLYLIIVVILIIAMLGLKICKNKPDTSCLEGILSYINSSSPNEPMGVSMMSFRSDY